MERVFKSKKKGKREKKEIRRIIKMKERVNKYNIIFKVEIRKNSIQITLLKYWLKITKWMGQLSAKQKRVMGEKNPIIHLIYPIIEDIKIIIEGAIEEAIDQMMWSKSKNKSKMMRLIKRWITS